MLVDVTSEDARWLLRIFGDAEDELLARWLRFKAHFHAAPSSDAVLLQHAGRWLTEVARSAETLGFTQLADICRAGCTLTNAPESRRDPNHLWEYDHWVAAVLAAADLPRTPGVRELNEAYWGATHRFEMCWYLMAPLIPRPVDGEPYLAVAEHGGVCQVTDSGATVSRFSTRE